MFNVTHEPLYFHMLSLVCSFQMANMWSKIDAGHMLSLSWNIDSIETTATTTTTTTIDKNGTQLQIHLAVPLATWQRACILCVTNFVLPSLFLTENDLDKSIGDTSDIISDSSGVGTNSDSAACSIGHPSTTVVCIESYTSNTPGHLNIQAGDVIEVVGSTDCGLLEGYVRGTNRSGFFPTHVVQEVSIRQKNITNVSTANQQNSIYQRNTVINMHPIDQQTFSSSSAVNNGNGGSQQLEQHESQQQPPPPHQQYSSATAPRQKKM